VGVPGGLLNFFSEKRPKLVILAFWRVSRHPQPRAQFSKSDDQESADLRPAAWPGLRLVKLGPGPGVSAVSKCCGCSLLSAGRWLAKKWFQIWMYVCMYLCWWNKMCLKRSLSWTFIKFPKRFRYQFFFLLNFLSDFVRLAKRWLRKGPKKENFFNPNLT
jgi:hypothetical protein